MLLRARTTRSTPSPPRRRPAPPESGTRAYRSTTMGNLNSACSFGLLWVSPSLMQTVPETPSSVILAPQPPPSGPKLPMKNSDVLLLMPWNDDASRSAWWPAITRPGIAGASALKIVSTMVIGYVIHQRMGAGRTALIARPGGTMVLRLRNEPSLMG